MNGFVFDLETVLDCRKAGERQRQRDLAMALRTVQLLDEQIGQLRREVRQRNAELRNGHLVGEVDVAYLETHRRHLQEMDRRASGMVAERVGAQAQVQKAQKMLVEESRQRRVMEKLRERQYERWRADQERRELTEADEIAAHTWHARESG